MGNIHRSETGEKLPYVYIVEFKTGEVREIRRDPFGWKSTVDHFSKSEWYLVIRSETPLDMEKIRIRYNKWMQKKNEKEIAEKSRKQEKERAMCDKRLGNVMERKEERARNHNYIVDLMNGETYELSPILTRESRNERVRAFRKSEGHLIIQSDAPLTFEDIRGRYLAWAKKQEDKKPCGQPPVGADPVDATKDMLSKLKNLGFDVRVIDLR
jgi:hypothetical protein